MLALLTYLYCLPSGNPVGSGGKINMVLSLKYNIQFRLTHTYISLFKFVLDYKVYAI